jgi:hypothetical protein
VHSTLHIHNGAMIPKEVVRSDVYFPPPVYSTIDTDITKRVLEFVPSNRYERGLWKNYIRAEEKLRRLEGELKIKTAQEEVSMKLKSIRKATADFARAQHHFVTNGRWIADHPHQDYEIDGDIENEDEDEGDEDSDEE